MAGVGFLVFSGVFVFFLVFLCFFWCFLVFSGVFWFFLVFLCFWWWWWCVIDCSKKPGKVFGGGCLVVAERALYLRVVPHMRIGLRRGGPIIRWNLGPATGYVSFALLQTARVKFEIYDT